MLHSAARNFVVTSRTSRMISGVALAIACVSSTSCKEAQDSGPDDSRTVAGVPSTNGNGGKFWADARREISGSAEFFFNVWDQSFTQKLSELPASGTVPQDKIPYSGHWYPELNGGTNVLLNGTSPLEKYDRAFNGGNPRAVQWERDNHTLSPGDPAAEWSGHCNGWAAAASRHKEPTRRVTRGGVTFEPHDIKALLAEIYMSAKYFFVGGNRCEQQGAPGSPLSRPDPTQMNECEDVNPGTFHVAIGNWIGRKNYPLIADESAVNQIWNYPLYRYTSQIQTITQSEAQRRIGGTGATYIFNRNAVRFAGVTTTIYMARALQSEPLGNVAPSHQVLQQTLTYVLELNAADEIIGGEWIGQSQQVHPDFMWIALEPVQGNGTRFFGNPHVNVQEVLRLWAESVGVDPNNPPPTLQEPIWLQDWGRYPNFELTLDGGQTGAVFLGKQARLLIKRREKLIGNVSVEVSLNGASPTTLTGQGNADLLYAFTARAGVNEIGLSWKRAGAEFEDNTIRFHAVP